MFCARLANGDVIVTLLPVNTRWPWITPAQFRPELVPEELMAQGLTVSCLINPLSITNMQFQIARSIQYKYCKQCVFAHAILPTVKYVFNYSLQ